MSEKTEYINAENYEKIIKENELVIVDWYSTECPPCEALATKYDSLSELYGNDVKFVKIFRQENKDLAAELGISGSPTVTFYKNGKLTGETLRGGIKRSSLIENLNTLLPSSRVTKINSLTKTSETSCDVLILGGGPAGLSAGIYTAQAKLNTIIIDIALPGGQVATTHLVSNFPGQPKAIQGFMLAHYMSEQAKEAGVSYRSAVDVTNINLAGKKITIDSVETITAKKIIIATGASPRALGIPGELEYKGQGISYCATCDAKYYEGKEVVVVGGGNSAIEEALFLAKFASKITIVHQFDKLQANKQAQEKAFNEKKISFLFKHEPREFKKTDNGITITLEDLKTKEVKKLETNGVFMFVGMNPNIDGMREDLTLDEWGYVKSDEEMRTNIKDVYAAGDVRSKMYRQITTAVADGTIASISISKELEN